MANDNTDRQRVLELQHNMPIEDVLRSHLEKHRAERDMVDACCADLGIGIGTFYRWTRLLNISVKAYPPVAPVNA